MREVPKVAQSLTCLLFMAMASCAFESEQGRFRVAFPCTPAVSAAPHPAFLDSLHIFSCDTGQVVYSVVYHDFPDTLVRKHGFALIEAEVKGYTGAASVSVTARRTISHDGVEAIELAYQMERDGSQLQGLRRFMLLSNRAYTIYVVWNKTHKSLAAARKFLESLSLQNR